MQKKLKILLLTLVLAGSFSVFIGLASGFTATSKNRTATENCNVFYDWFSIGDKDNAVEGLPQFCTAQQTISWVITVLLAFAGSIAVIFLMVGGFRYLTSAGNEEAAEKAKKTLVTSIIGLAVIILAAAIVRIVANTLSIGKESPAKIDENEELNQLEPNTPPANDFQPPPDLEPSTPGPRS